MVTQTGQDRMCQDIFKISAPFQTGSCSWLNKTRKQTNNQTIETNKPIYIHK